MSRRPRDLPSPNHGPRPTGARVRFVVLHYTGMATGAEARARLTDPRSGVSAHYLLEEDGTLWRLVAETRRAWHAGRGAWGDWTDLNGVSVGIELVHPGHDFGYRPFARAQIEALCALLEELLARHRLGPEAVIGHSDLAPRRKRDPGEFFPWPELARRGLAFWPPATDRRARPDPLRARALLRCLGYRPDLPEIGFTPAVRAFQRRFRPARVDGILDAGTMGRLLEVTEALTAGGCARARARAPRQWPDPPPGR